MVGSPLVYLFIPQQRGENVAWEAILENAWGEVGFLGGLGDAAPEMTETIPAPATTGVAARKAWRRVLGGSAHRQR